MTIKSIVRFVVGLFLAALLLNIALPYAGIPKAQLYPPPFVYGNATGKTRGVVTRTYKQETSDPFHVGEKLSYVEYRFRAPYTPLLFGDPKSDPAKVYTGVAQVKNEDFDKFKQGVAVPIRFETTYPVISGIDHPTGGMNVGKGSGILSGWIGWAIVTVVIGYFLSGTLERFMLRESY
ncbi:MAG: hypothetical protein SFU56_19985 [Capsulimonadales bacterium]|nr:hypothetical protein [Capsulimonadales bacterium]